MGPLSLGADVIAVMLFLFPGFVAYLVYRAVTPKGVVPGDLDKLVYALVFSGIAYTVLGLLGFSPATSHLFDTAYQAVVFLVAIVLGAAAGVCTTKGWLLECLVRLRLTDQTTRATTWLEAIMKYGRTYVLVETDRGELYLGWPEFYDATGTEIFLTDASRIDRGSNKRYPIDGPGVLLVGGIRVVDFLKCHQEKGECEVEQEP